MAKQRLHLKPDLDGILWPYRALGDPLRRVHRHDELEFNLVLSGSASYLVDDRRYDLARGSLIWLFPEQEHLLIDESADYRMWIGVTKPAALGRWVEAGAAAGLVAGRPDRAFCHLLSESVVDDLDALLAQVRRAETDPPVFNHGLAFAVLSAWRLHELADASPPGAEVHPAVERAARLIRRQPELNDIDAIARAAGLSPSRLSRLFKAQTGASLTSYRQRCRLDRFVELYGRGRRRNLTEAALAAGFGSYPQFHRVFRQFYGFSPRQYVREAKG